MRHAFGRRLHLGGLRSDRGDDAFDADLEVVSQSKHSRFALGVGFHLLPLIRLPLANRAW